MTISIPLPPGLFIGYYSRQERPTDNDLIRAYGAKADISNGVANATFEMFPISPTSFVPLFPGPVAVTDPCKWWQFDHVWAQERVYLKDNARYDGCDYRFPYYRVTSDQYQHFMADDYTWAAADASFFYFAWCDRSQPYDSGQGVRPDANIRFAKIKP